MRLWLLIGVAYSLICCTQRLVPRHCKFTCSRACIVNNCQLLLLVSNRRSAWVPD